MEVDEGAVVEREPNWTKGRGKGEVEVAVEEALTVEPTPAVLLSLQVTSDKHFKTPIMLLYKVINSATDGIDSNHLTLVVVSPEVLQTLNYIRDMKAPRKEINSSDIFAWH